MSDVDDPMEHRQYGWVLLNKLGTPSAPPESILDDLGLTEVVSDAEWCYEVRNTAHLLIPDSVRFDDHTPWLRRAFGLAGSVAESLVVCLGCESEIAGLKATQQPVAEIGGRFFSIASAHEIIGIGHRLVNIVQRALSARADFRDLLRASSDGDLRNCSQIADPRSTDRRAWLSLNVPTARAIDNALSSVTHAAVRSAVGGLVDLAQSTEWLNLVDMRGDVFHRSRPESSINFGADAESGHGEPITDSRGVVIGYAAGPTVRYSEGDLRWQTEAAATRSALIRVSRAAREVTLSLVRAVEPLTHGHRTFDVTGSRIRTHEHFGGLWDEASCGCCVA